MLKLPDNLDEATLFSEPVTVFKIDPALRESDFLRLKGQLDSISEFGHEYSKRGGKKKTSISGHNYSLYQGSPLGDLTKFVLSDEFFHWFRATHLPHFEHRHPLFVRDRKSMVGFLLRLGRRLGLPYSLFFAEVEISSITQGKGIPPHTDDSSKRLSFVLYMGGEGLSEIQAKKLGTVFFAGKPGHKTWSGYESGLLDESETARFYQDHEELTVVPFKPNTIAGFIKSDISWHAVRPNELEFDRRAIVINVFAYGE